jgi:hypothetical protein
MYDSSIKYLMVVTSQFWEWNSTSFKQKMIKNKNIQLSSLFFVLTFSEYSKNTFLLTKTKALATN